MCTVCDPRRKLLEKSTGRNRRRERLMSDILHISSVDEKRLDIQPSELIPCTQAFDSPCVHCAFHRNTGPLFLNGQSTVYQTPFVLLNWVSICACSNHLEKSLQLLMDRVDDMSQEIVKYDTYCRNLSKQQQQKHHVFTLAHHSAGFKQNGFSVYPPPAYGCIYCTCPGKSIK